MPIAIVFSLIVYIIIGDMHNDKKNKNNILSKNEYVEISPYAAIASVRAGVVFNREYTECGEMWYFEKPHKSEYYCYQYEDKVYVNWKYLDRKRFEYMYKKYTDEKENEKVLNNHSEDGYKYLIQAVEKHRKECTEKAQEAMDNATESYFNSYKNFYNSVNH